MPNRAKDWFAQAGRDLEQACASQRDGRHEWACFAAQQAAEKAIKGLHLAKGQEAWGHVVATLLRDLPSSVPELLIQKAQFLDTLYIATRYVNGHAAGAPFEHYSALQSQQAIDYAGEILNFARSQVA